MLSDLERRRAMKVKTVLKALFPGGSRGSVPASAAGREAMPGTVTGGERARKTSPAAWRHKDLQPLEPPADVSAWKTFPNPLVDATQKPSSHHRGFLRRKNKQIDKSESLEASDFLAQMLSDLERRRGMDREPLWKATFPEGREAMPGTGTGDWDQDMDYLKALAQDSLKSLENAGDEPVGEGDLASQPTSRTEIQGAGEVIEQKSVLKEAFPRGSSGSVPASPAGGTAMPGTGTGTGTGGAAGTSTHVPNSQKEDGKGFCQDIHCWLKLMAFLVVLELVFMSCCIGTWYYWKRKRSASAASQDRTKPSVGDTFACHRPSPCQCQLALSQLPFQLVALLPPPRTRPSVPRGAGPGVRPGLKVAPSFQGV
ncbi:PREDICTED: uncharacterized protein LOC107603907 [Ficedula albicollis]|uniref:uncharacterized protein LOC107603907 n=1 Tax=Ficedula albicollis TaxID=59894 RepID=UPI0007AD8CC4|nr:PREDICTED: uncharacterized protein LOC107603907 [Ficedula albicollis]